MAKTPFQFKPTSKSVRVAERAGFVGASDVLATYSDTFILLNEAETGMASLYFYQRMLGDMAAQLGTTHTGNLYSGAKCVSRIVMSPQAMEKLLVALAENRGFNLTPKPKEDEK